MALLRRCVFLALLLASGFITSSVAAQTDFKTVVVFGDSLSDTGNIANLVQHATALGIRYPADNTLLGFDYTDGRFTDGADTQPAAQAYFGVWIEQLAASLPSHPAVKDSLDGGTNYAYGDATTANGTTTESETVDLIPVSITLANMGQQVADYLATNPTPNAQTLYVLWGGANDVYQASGTGGNPTAAATTAVSNEMALVQQLIADGARNFMIPNLPPLGGVPSYATDPSAATALNTASGVFAAALVQGINAVKLAAQAQGITITVYQPDILTLFATVAGNPSAVGLFNVSAPAQNVPFDPDTYLIWDGLHPTTMGHHLAAATAANLVNPLVASSTALTSPAVALAGQNITLSAKVSPSSGTVAATGDVTFFVAANGLGAPLNSSGTASTTYDAGLVTEGTTTVTAGTYSVTAVYAGDTRYSGSASAAQPLTVLAAAVGTTTTLGASTGAANTGQPFTLTATVAPAVSTYGEPNGTVTFLDGTTTLGTGTLSNGVATYTTSSLSSGTHSITASYAASGIFGGSTSAAESVVVTAPGFTPVVTPTSLSISGSGSGTVMASATSVGGFAGALTLSCGALPAHFTCAFSTATYTLCGNCNAVQAPVTLTIGTSAAVTPSVKRAALSTQSGTPLAFAGAMGALLLLGLQRRKLKRGAWLAGITVVCFSAAASFLTGCGGSGPNVGPGTYTIPVVFTPSAAAGSTPAVSPQTVNVVVTVQ